MSTSIVTDNGVPDQSSCAICMCHKNTVQSHHCIICTKDAWTICRDCNDKMTTCPVCRTPMNPINVSINIHTEISNSRRRSGSNRNESCNCLYYMVIMPIFFVICVYAGKIYIYLYCKGTCTMDKDGNPETCQCYDFASREGYWVDFSYSLLEFLLGLVASAILFSCCCLKNN